MERSVFVVHEESNMFAGFSDESYLDKSDVFGSSNSAPDESISPTDNGKQTRAQELIAEANILSFRFFVSFRSRIERVADGIGMLFDH